MKLTAYHEAGQDSFYKVARRVSARFQPKVRRSFLKAVKRLQDRIDEIELRSAVASGNLSAIEAAAGVGIIGAGIEGDDALRKALADTSSVTGHLGAEILEDATGLAVSFNAVNPNVVLFARQQVAELVVRVSDDVKEAIRIVVAAGAEQGLTHVQQARAIREIVGLPPNWAQAPLRLGEELRDGKAAEATARRLSATDKAQIRSRIKNGTVTEDFVERMQTRYTDSLVNRRALNIARTETSRASHGGLRLGWQQAIEQEVLPVDTKRVWIVTLDDRLRPTHAEIPIRNPEGVGMDEPFDTPFGAVLDPPAEPNCRCGVGLVFPQAAAVTAASRRTFLRAA